MRSVRLGKELEARLKKAVQRTGMPASEIIRQGVDDRVAALLGETAADHWADVIGAFASGRAGVARNSGAVFATEIRRKRSATLSPQRRRKAG